MNALNSLGGQKRKREREEEEEEEIPGSIYGEEEGNLNVVDTTMEPMLTKTEWNKLKTCERPCSKDEWRGMTYKNKWGTLGNLGYACIGRKEEKKEGPKDEVKRAVSIAGTPRRVAPPKSANPPPPKPPPTLGSDRRGEIVDAKGEKWKEQGQRHRKTKWGNGAWAQETNSKGRKPSYQSKEEKGPSQYTSCTSREQHCGALKKQEA